MLLDIRHLNLPVSNARHELTRRRVAWALRPSHDVVSRVDVRTRDVNGPLGGVDIQCSVTVALAAVKQGIVVRNKSADAYAAIQGACARAKEAVARALARRRRLDRSRALIPDTSRPRVGPASETRQMLEYDSKDIDLWKSRTDLSGPTISIARPCHH
jgi:hypothetical protein